MSNRFILVTMRQDCEPVYGELRDALDCKWWTFLESAGLVPVLVPNHLSTAELIIKGSSQRVNGFLLTGGGTYQAEGDDERSSIERKMIEIAMTDKLPLLGVCRGMQAIQQYFGVPLHPVNGHVRANQKIYSEWGEREVNSFHNFGTKDTVRELIVAARSHDDIVKAIDYRNAPIKGIMWHPERFKIPQHEDIKLFREHFQCQ